MQLNEEAKNLFGRCVNINLTNIATILNGFKDLELLCCAKDYSLNYFSYLDGQSFSGKTEEERDMLDSVNADAVSDQQRKVVMAITNEFNSVDGLKETLNVLHEMIQSSILLSLISFKNPSALVECFGSKEKILKACEEHSYGLLKEAITAVFIEDCEEVDLMFLNIIQLQKLLLNLNDGLSESFKLCGINHLLSDSVGCVDFNNIGSLGIQAINVGNTYNNFTFDLNEEFTNGCNYYA